MSCRNQNVMLTDFESMASPMVNAAHPFGKDALSMCTIFFYVG